MIRAQERLEQAGYERIGRIGSAYAMIFAKPSENSVLKLYKKEDTAFTAFVAFCRENNNQHFPKFSRNSIAIKDTEYNAVRTERLKEGSPGQLKEVAKYFKDYCRYSPKEYDEDFVHWAEANASLMAAFKLLTDRFDRSIFAGKLYFDLHSQNMMMRGNTVVIIDPVAPAPSLPPISW
ncbi:unnamed protein product [Sphagnum tenellum]